MSANRVKSPIRRDLRASCVDGCAFSVMVGAGETYFAAFALALGVDKVAAGLVATVPLLLGAAIQLVSPWAVRRLGSNGRWVVWTSAAQAASFAPLIVGAWTGRMSTTALFVVVSVYFGAGFASGPAWTTWIETLVPGRITQRYFARRTAWCYVALVAALALAGDALSRGDAAGQRVVAFAGLFAAAAAARVVSTRCLMLQREPVPKPPGQRHLSMTELLRDPSHRDARRLIVFLLASFGAVQMAQPFVTSYVRGVMHLPYGGLAALLAVPFVARVVSLPWLGRIAQRLGTRRLMWIGSLAFVPAAAMWAFASSVAAIAVAQAVTGFALAAFELANLLLWFETIRPEERTSLLTTYQFWYAAAIVAGSAVGSVVLVQFGEGREAFVVLFLVSAVARLGASALFLRCAPTPAAASSNGGAPTATAPARGGPRPRSGR